MPGPIGTIIDVGASNGSWSIEAKLTFPEAWCLLIEALGAHEPALVELTRTRTDIAYVLAAAGNAPGEISFLQNGDIWGGAASHNPASDGTWVTVPMTTIDREVKSRELPGPYLVKLDTHGFEVPIFEGATATLPQTELIVVEAYNFTLGSGALRFSEMCAYLEGKGFRCADMIDPSPRPLDGALWQVDLVFVPITRLPISADAAGGYGRAVPS